MATPAEQVDASSLDVWTDVEAERVGTAATVVTFVRTAIAVVLAGVAAREDSLPLLVASLGVYWVGDMLDGAVARVLGCETRIGAALDILCDRFCAAAFYVGLMWLDPDLAPAVLVYLAEFMVVDCFLSLAFLAWPIRSPNYFYVVDRPLWLWNWSKPGKAVNSSLFAVLLLVTGWVAVGVAIASALLLLKCLSLARLMRLGLPIPAR
ncbi:MAG: CDP-alcohol phosphatidyltransferase [uncultured Nocardioidaceae bacterium]|uniref:CDP-alcohol phosphatidyltransferase n=1 Tax=uncultured Nocardioidaceae bacterium TaxID=253824 RepID=A0A6J4MW07_9ACTN|nr:MAG: CDP-alcohol phosphatidyltransferase [uncultured Nocardioidaceae bacterium]